MNKFRTMGLIDYDNNGFTVRTELLTDLLLHFFAPRSGCVIYNESNPVEYVSQTTTEQH
jgi:hypothetical protein